MSFRQSGGKNSRFPTAALNYWGMQRVHSVFIPQQSCRRRDMSSSSWGCVVPDSWRNRRMSWVEKWAASAHASQFPNNTTSRRQENWEVILTDFFIRPLRPQEVNVSRRSGLPISSYSVNALFLSQFMGYEAARASKVCPKVSSQTRDRATQDAATHGSPTREAGARCLRPNKRGHLHACMGFQY